MKIGFVIRNFKHVIHFIKRCPYIDCMSNRIDISVNVHHPIKFVKTITIRTIENGFILLIH